MDVDPLVLGRLAMEDVRCLVKPGGRLAGSANEAQALAWIDQQLRGLGYATHLEPFSFPKPPKFLPYYSLAGLAAVLCAWLLPVFPWPALAMPILVQALPDLSEALSRRLPAKATSANLLALPVGVDLTQLEVLFVAHVDAAAAIPAGGDFTRSLRRQAFPILHRVAIILALLGVVYLFHLPVGAAIAAAALTLAAVTGLGAFGLDLYDQLGARGACSPGANDNASGVTALLGAARQLGAQTELGERVGFLFTGAEEAGLCGARAFAETLRQSGARPWVVSVDMVGAGQKLRMITGAQTLRTVRTDTQVKALLERADHAAVPHLAVRRSGDFVPFAKAGFATGALEAEGTREFWRAYHTEDDGLSLIEPEMLGHVVFTLLRLVELRCKESRD